MNAASQVRFAHGASDMHYSKEQQKIMSSQVLESSRHKTKQEEIYQYRSKETELKETTIHRKLNLVQQ